MSARLPGYILLILLVLSAGCANITAPTGGRKDTIPPKLVTIDPPDSLKNTKVTRLEMHFNEYITVTDVTKEVQLSPILNIQPTVTGKNKTVIVKIVDSLLEPNTTYRLSFGSSIRDLHEGNPFPKYTYSFSTGAYFDSLQLHGTVINAATGLPDSGTILMELYNASDNDSAVVRHKPRYVTNTDASGNFLFKGLPKRPFHLYAIKDANSNMLYDGPVAGESVGFVDSIVVPSDTSQAAINFSVFAEILDTAAKKVLDSATSKKDTKKQSKPQPETALTYSVNIDTSNTEKRTFDITSLINITFNKLPILNKDKITLTYDSLGITVSPAFTFILDSATNKLKINTVWKENMVYKLRLVKGFAKDTSGVEVVPSKYNSTLYVLRVLADNDSIYQKPVTDTTIILTRLKPANYIFRIIVDKNHNGIWDTGDLLAKKQPEEIIPYKESIKLRQGFELIISDFDKKLPPVKDKNAPKSK